MLDGRALRDTRKAFRSVLQGLPKPQNSGLNSGLTAQYAFASSFDMAL
jgi:hypothetical protein